MGNSRSRALAMLGKTHVPDLEWKIHDFSALLETKATAALSDRFHCLGYQWFLQVSPMHKKTGGGTPYVALNLIHWPYTSEKGQTVHAVFEFSIYDHSNGMYCGCKASHSFDFKNSHSNKHCLIPLQELLKSSAFLVDDSCVFGVKILKLDVSSPEKNAVVVEKKATTVQNLFVQKKGFVKGTYTWTMNNFLEVDLKYYVRSPTFEVGGYKWCPIIFEQSLYMFVERYIGMYPRGDKRSTDCLALYLSRDASNELPPNSRNVVEMTLSIHDQKNGKHLTLTSGSALLSNYQCSFETYLITAGLLVFGSSWGWRDFIPLKKFKDPSGGYLVESNCVVEANFTIVGSSSDG